MEVPRRHSLVLVSLFSFAWVHQRTMWSTSHPLAFPSPAPLEPEHPFLQLDDSVASSWIRTTDFRHDILMHQSSATQLSYCTINLHLFIDLLSLPLLSCQRTRHMGLSVAEDFYFCSSLSSWLFPKSVFCLSAISLLYVSLSPRGDLWFPYPVEFTSKVFVLRIRLSFS